MGPLRLKVSDDGVRVRKIPVDKFMNPMTSRILTGLFVVVITSSMLGARAGIVKLTVRAAKQRG
jgi:hypothetical protein